MNYNIEEIKKQAEYCLNCKTRPCTKGCPLENNIPEFIEELKKGNRLISLFVLLSCFFFLLIN